MPRVISSFVPFPSISWWSLVISADELILDAAEHFEKMTYRNKYFIAGANGTIQLSIPLQRGRNQRAAMSNVLISNEDQWQKQHWRGIISTYKRAPFFEYYEHSLEQLFAKEFNSLIDFNRESINWLAKQLKLKLNINTAERYMREYDDAIDIRKQLKPDAEKQTLPEGIYYQMFEERNQFTPNLSMLDLLFSEGPNTVNVLKQNEVKIRGWINYVP